MSSFRLVFAYLLARPIVSLFHILLMALGMAITVGLLLFGQQLQDRFYKDSAGIDLVVGAKGSPLQLILSSIQHMDIPTGNIPYQSAMKLASNRNIKTSIPLALGDRYRAYRIVGTDHSYVRHFGGEFQKGKLWDATLQVVLGAQVAAETGMQIGASFVGDHGLVESGGAHTHNEHPYRVVGILKTTGRVIDRLILTSLGSVWDVHGETSTSGLDSKEITALLIRYRNRAAAFSLPRQINNRTAFQAASPAFEMARLMNLVGIGRDTLFYIGGILIALSLLGVLIGLINAIRERKYDLALFRVLGASPRKIMTLIIMEGMTIAVLGSSLGVLFGHLGVEFIGVFSEKGIELGLEGLVFLPTVYIIWAGVLGLSVAACFVPAWEAYRTNIKDNLLEAR